MILISPHPTGHGLQISELKRKLEFCKSYMDEFDICVNSKPLQLQFLDNKILTVNF